MVKCEMIVSRSRKINLGADTNELDPFWHCKLASPSLSANFGSASEKRSNINLMK